MTDILKRLRSFDVFNAPMDIDGIMVSPVALMAADEIERLRKKLAWWDEQSREMLEAVEKAEAERDRLREALWDCVETWRPLLADADLTAHENPAYLTLMHADLVLGEDHA
jgi:hypothetical protein